MGLVAGFLAVALGVALLFFVMSPERVSAARRQGGGDAGKSDKGVLANTSEALVNATDRALQQSSRAPVTAHDLEIAGIHTTAGNAVVLVLSVAVGLGAVIVALTSSLFAGALLAVIVPVAAKIYLMFKIDARRKEFADQLEETLQIIASSLRAGHSFVGALDAVSQNSVPPTSEEFARIINEHRIGRDQIDAMTQTAERMDSEDFRWVTEAVEVHRETGGNLNEIIDRVAETIRARRELKLQVTALAAEGRFSAIVLMALPPLGALIFMGLNPDYMSVLFTSTAGKIVICFSLVLYLIGGLWMKKLVDVRL